MDVLGSMAVSRAGDKSIVVAAARRLAAGPLRGWAAAPTTRTQGDASSLPHGAPYTSLQLG